MTAMSLIVTSFGFSLLSVTVHKCVRARVYERVCLHKYVGKNSKRKNERKKVMRMRKKKN